MRKQLTMRILMNDHASFEGAVPVGHSVVPDVHPHSCGLAIWRCCKIRVVHARAVLCIEVHKVVSKSALSIIVDFKVSGFFSEAEIIQEIVVHI